MATRVERLTGVAAFGSRAAGWAAWAGVQRSFSAGRYTEVMEQLWVAREAGGAAGDGELVTASVRNLIT